jgi:hypothetical protein
MLAISSCLGLLPAWVRDEIEVSPSSRYMKWLAEEYHLIMSRETADQITESLAIVLQKRFGGYFSKRMVENILCKVYRRRTNNKSDEKFWDLLFPRQMLFSCEGEALVINYPGRRPRVRVVGALVGEWALGRESMDMDQLCRSLGLLGNGLPSKQEITDWTVPNALMFGKGMYRKNGLSENRIPIDCQMELATRLEKLSRKLRVK